MQLLRLCPGLQRITSLTSTPPSPIRDRDMKFCQPRALHVCLKLYFELFFGQSLGLQKALLLCCHCWSCLSFAHVETSNGKETRSHQSSSSSQQSIKTGNWDSLQCMPRSPSFLCCGAAKSPSGEYDLKNVFTKTNKLMKQKIFFTSFSITSI